MATNQGDRQASVRAATGTALTYEGDFHALFTQAGIANGSFNGRLLAWINSRLGSSYSELNGAMYAFAANQGFTSWGAMGTFEASGAPASGAITTAQAGNWSSPSTWTGGVVPRNGNTVTINHNVTVDGITTIGSSPASALLTGTPGTTAAISIASGKTLTVASGVTLRCRGDIDNGGILSASAGSNIIFDTSAAAAPTTTHYVLDCWNAAYTVSLQVNGSSGSRCAIGSSNTSYWRLTGGERHDGSSNPQAFRGVMQASYCDFSRMGDASNNGWTFQGDIGGATNTQVSAANCTFDACGKITHLLALYGRTGFDLMNCTFTNSPAVDYSLQLLTGADLTSGAITRRVQGCAFDKPVRFDPGKTFVIQDNVFLSAFEVYDYTGTLTGNFICNVADNAPIQLPWGSSLVDNYYAHNQPTDLNPHFFIVQNGAGASSLTGNVFEYLKSDDTGECFIMLGAASGTASTNVATISGNISLPNAAGKSPGAMINSQADDNYKIIAKNNTVFLGGIEGGFTSGETSTASTAGLWSRITNNLFWDTSARGYKFKDIAADGTFTDLVASGDADYNGGWNFLAGSNLNGYNQLEFSSGAPGAHDINADPQFVDSTRNLAKWDLSLGGPGTAAHALAEMAKRNTPTFNSSYTVANLRAYVRAGFVPLNTVYAGAGDPRDSSPDLGAVSVDTTPAAPVNVVAPSISGSATVGGTLTANDGAWSGYPRPTFTRQFYADGVLISGATGTTYSPVSGDTGKTITVISKATNTQAPSGVTATSAGVGPVIAAGLTYTATSPAVKQEFSGGLTSGTFAAQAIGAASANRRVIVQITGNINGGVSGVTIGGVTATIDITVGSASVHTAAIASAIVPTGTTADVVVTAGTNFGLGTVIVKCGTVYGAAATGFVATSATRAFGTSEGSIGPLTVGSGQVGVVVLEAQSNNATLSGVTVDESYDNPSAFNECAVFAHATSTFTATAANTDSNGNAMAAVVYKP